jgi:hypothetical protein
MKQMKFHYLIVVQLRILFFDSLLFALGALRYVSFTLPGLQSIASPVHSFGENSLDVRGHARTGNEGELTGKAVLSAEHFFRYPLVRRTIRSTGTMAICKIGAKDINRA